MLLLSSAAAQNATGPASVQSIAVAQDGEDLRVEVTISSPVTPAVEVATHPDRIVLDFPNTSCKVESEKAVNARGVLRVRTAQHSTSPAVARVVLDLDQAHPYRLQSEGNRISVIVSPAAAARNSHRDVPVPATSGTLIGIFHRKQSRPAPTTEDDSAALAIPVPPPGTASPSLTSPAPIVRSESATAPVPSSATATVSPESSTGQGSFPQTQIDTGANARDSATAAEALAPSIPNTATAAPHPAASENTSTADSPAASAAPSPEATAATLIARTDDPSLRTVFKVKYVAEGIAYLEGGKAQGLAEGMKLVIEDSNLPAKQGDSVDPADPRIVAELEVSAVAETSAVTDIHAPKRAVKVGDLAYLSSSDAAALVQQRTLSSTRQYPAVISFTEGDTVDEEARQEVPRPPLPSVNRARGRMGFDYIDTISHGTSSMTSSDLGFVFRGDITRIGGTYWNLSGYWRGRFTNTSAASQQTLQNLINRTYHLNMTYDNPMSDNVAGFGRLYLPWAPSLDTIDGGYFGKRLSKGTTVGIFGGSTPDPSSWDYSPNRVIGGGFINFEGGDYNAMHYSSTSGAGVSLVNWQIDRPFIFVEDSVSYGRSVAVYESAQFDNPAGNSATPSPGPGLGRSFFNLRVQPHPRIELDLNHTYFRDIPTFDPTLIGTGLLDKFLFQGFSGGGRVEVWKQVWLSTNIGRSSRSGDTRSSWNQMYGITFGRVPKLHMRMDAHYARFNSSFGSGSYEALSVSRQVSDRLRVEVLAGQQNFTSSLTTNDRARFVTGTVETTLGPHYYLQSNFTTNRGAFNYDQFMISFGYRFDSKRHRE
jgi:hypothetical protein